MNSDRKRKLGESENEQFIMTLLKRLHLERSSELFEKVPLSSKTPPPPSSPLTPLSPTGNKRWRLSTIMEEDQDAGAAKRRRIDTEMADNLFHNLWISDNSKEEEEKVPTATNTPEETSETVEEPPSFTIVGVRNGGLSLEEEFLKRKLREQQLQLVLWTPPLTVDTIVQNSQHPPLPGDSFKNEEGDSEYMC